MTENQRDLAIRLLESVLRAVKSDPGDDPQSLLITAASGDGITAKLTIRFEMSFNSGREPLQQAPISEKIFYPS